MATTATNQTSFQRDMQIEKRFTKTVKQILGLYFVRQDVEADLSGGTDFLTFTVEPFRIGLRLRRSVSLNGYDAFSKYSRQFTIRHSRPSGVKTEIDKINEGLVDYILYGWLNAEETKIVQYFIGDLDVFRAMDLEPLETKPNKDNSSVLAAYGINQYPSEFILKAWPDGWV